MLLCLALLAACVVVSFDYTNGFHDASNVVATAIASRALSPAQAVCLAAAFEFLGPFLGGTAVADTVGGVVRLQHLPQVQALGILLAGLLGAITWNLVTWWRGIPSSSSHALVGGLVGAVLLASGSADVNWGWQPGALSGVAKLLLGLTISPLLGFGLAFVLHRCSRLLTRASHPSLNRRLRLLQIGGTAALAFAHGANDAQKGMGVLTLVLLLSGDIADFSVPWWVVLCCATAMSLGILSGGWRIVRTVGYSVYRVRALHAVDTQLTAGSLILAAAAFGAPVSTSHVVASSIMGIGASEWPHRVHWGKAGEIVLSWFITMPAAAAAAALFFLLLHPLFA